MHTIHDILLLSKESIDIYDATLLIAHITQKSREFVLTYPEHTLTQEQYDAVMQLIARRAHHEPLSYLTGHKEFFGREFEVTKHTLIPRPETELMVEEIIMCAKKNINEKKSQYIFDIGTGSGNIIISLAKELSLLYSQDTLTNFFSIDISSHALLMAKKNANTHDVKKEITFIQSDLLENISTSITQKNINTCIIAANLPYLSTDVYESSMDDVKKFEPKSALFSKENGLHHYRKLLMQLENIFNQRNIQSMQLFFEISPEQKNEIEKIIRDIFPQASIETMRDLSGKWRLTKASIKQ
jgi:release factor glutamine methyltransferase